MDLVCVITVSQNLEGSQISAFQYMFQKDGGCELPCTETMGFSIAVLLGWSIDVMEF